MEWVRDYKWNKNMERFELINSIYAYTVYRKMIKTFDDKGKYILNQEIDRFGFTMCVKGALLKFSLYLHNEEMKKKRFVEEMSRRENRIDKRQLRKIDQEIEEQQRWAGLSEEEIRLKNGPARKGDNTWGVVTEFIKSGVIHEYKYKIYEKSFGLYTLSIYNAKNDRLVYSVKSRNLYGYDGVAGNLLERAALKAREIETAVPKKENEYLKIETDNFTIEVDKKGKKGKGKSKEKDKDQLREIFDDMGLPTDVLDYL